MQAPRKWASPFWKGDLVAEADVARAAANAILLRVFILFVLSVVCFCYIYEAARSVYIVPDLTEKN